MDIGRRLPRVTVTLVGLTVLLSSPAAAESPPGGYSCTVDSIVLPDNSGVAQSYSGIGSCTFSGEEPFPVGLTFTGQAVCLADGLRWTGTLDVTPGAVVGYEPWSTPATITASLRTPSFSQDPNVGELRLGSGQTGILRLDYDRSGGIDGLGDKFCSHYYDYVTRASGAFAGPPPPREESSACGDGNLGVVHDRDYRLFGNTAIGWKPGTGFAQLVRDDLVWWTPRDATSAALALAPVLGGVRIPGNSPSAWRIRMTKGLRIVRDAPTVLRVVGRHGRTAVLIAAVTRPGYRTADMEDADQPITLGTGEDGTVHVQHREPAAIAGTPGADVYAVVSDPDPFDVTACDVNGLGPTALPMPPVPVPTMSGPARMRARAFDDCRTNANRPSRAPGRIVHAYVDLICTGPYPYQVDARVEVKKRISFGPVPTPFFNWPMIAHDISGMQRPRELARAHPYGRCKDGTHTYRTKFQETVLIGRRRIRPNPGTTSGVNLSC